MVILFLIVFYVRFWMSISMITKDTFLLVMSFLEWNIDVKWLTFCNRFDHSFCVVNVSTLFGNFWGTICGFLDFACHWRNFSGIRFISDVMNWNVYFVTAIWLNVMEFCWNRYQFTIFPFYKFTITIASPNLVWKKYFKILVDLFWGKIILFESFWHTLKVLPYPW